MHCTNESHHQDSGEECSPKKNHREDRRVESPHDMHWHINKNSFKGWGLNFVYFALHAVEIYLILRLVK
jgi:hypothetical protein